MWFIPCKFVGVRTLPCLLLWRQHLWEHSRSSLIFVLLFVCSFLDSIARWVFSVGDWVLGHQDTVVCMASRCRHSAETHSRVRAVGSASSCMEVSTWSTLAVLAGEHVDSSTIRSRNRVLNGLGDLSHRSPSSRRSQWTARSLSTLLGFQPAFFLLSCPFLRRAHRF